MAIIVYIQIVDPVFENYQNHLTMFLYSDTNCNCYLHCLNMSHWNIRWEGESKTLNITVPQISNAYNSVENHFGMLPVVSHLTNKISRLLFKNVFVSLSRFHICRKKTHVFYVHFMNFIYKFIYVFFLFFFAVYMVCHVYFLVFPFTLNPLFYRCVNIFLFKMFHKFSLYFFLLKNSCLMSSY